MVMIDGIVHHGYLIRDRPTNFAVNSGWFYLLADTSS